MAKGGRRQEILYAAQALFSRYGYDRVSMRDIAESVGISVGNLTYYFGKKEYVMVAVLEQMDRQAEEEIVVPTSVAEVDQLLDWFARRFSQSVFFSCLPESIGAALIERQKNRAELGHRVWSQTLENLVARGDMRPELYPGHYVGLLASVQVVLRYWAGFAEMEGSIGNDCPEFKQCIWSLLLPNLTAQGRDLFFERVMPGLRGCSPLPGSGGAVPTIRRQII